MYFNENLIKTQNVTKEQQEELKIVYQKLFGILEESYKTEDIDTLIGITKDIEKYEFELQELWNFPKNSNYHRYWIDINKCKCPKLDNRDYIYFGQGKIISGRCEIHNNIKDKDEQ